MWCQADLHNGSLSELQVYTGQAGSGGREHNLGERVIRDGTDTSIVCLYWKAFIICERLCFTGTPPHQERSQDGRIYCPDTIWKF